MGKEERKLRNTHIKSCNSIDKAFTAVSGSQSKDFLNPGDFALRDRRKSGLPCSNKHGPILESYIYSSTHRAACIPFKFL